MGQEFYMGGYRLLFLVNEHAFIGSDVLTKDAMREVRGFEEEFVPERLGKLVCWTHSSSEE